MKKIIFSFLISLIQIQISCGQDIYTIIDSVNAGISDYASFSYEIKVENVKDSIKILLDKGKLIVNNTQGKYDDFLYISYHQKDTFCFVKDTLLRIKSGEIRKDYSPDALHVRLGTTRMFFRCFSGSFRNETTLINPKRWDSLSLDSTNAQFYYLTLQDTMIEFGAIRKTTVNVVIDKNNFHISKYNYQFESRGDLINNVFTFSNWTSSSRIDDDVNSIYENMRQRSNSPEYLSKFPTRKMRLDKNKTLSLDDVSMIDSLDVNHRLGDIDKRYVVLYFWFEGCIHCKHVGPVIEKFYKLNKRQDIAYLGVDTMAKNKKSLLASIKGNHYDFPNYRYNEGVKDLTVNGAPMVIIYDNVKNKVLEQLLGGNPEYETNFSKLIDSLPIE
ncbi:MAG: TlpA family protein disulfide reductase [Saprospiraceae bacterium]|nr:TlpA family protein disulfide reductase [Saprospiraceae bacterium]MBP6567849.1 TlpA family protein disulfide reductase [Saprospiraceae bacterium]